MRDFRITVLVASVTVFGGLALPDNARAREETYPEGSRAVAAPGFSAEASRQNPRHYRS